MLPTSLSASAGGGGPSGASGSDISSGFSGGYSWNNAFSVGGSGKSNQNAESSAANPSAANPQSLLIFGGIAIAAIVGISLVLSK